MAEYYAVERSAEYLAHYGVRGMKWGVRRAIDKIRSNMRMSRNYMKAQKKLGIATGVGGIIGGTAYAATHRKELSKAKVKAGVNTNRRPQSKISRNIQKTKEYMNVNKDMTNKMMKAQLAGGLIGSAVYASRHKTNINKPKKQLQTSNTNSKKNLYANAMRAGKRVEDARKKLSAIGKMGFGKTAREYRNANIAAREATNAYYDSLSKKQYAKLRRKHIG